MISLVFDTETTGLPLPAIAPLEKQPKIIEFAYIKINDGKEIERNSWMINPGEQITEEITKITGITNEMLADKPPFSKVFPDIVKAFEGVDMLIAHNLPFDRGLLQFELRRIEELENFKWPQQEMCTVAEFRHLKGRRLKLIELYHIVLDKELFQTHRALDDVEALVEILMKEGIV